MGFKSGTPLTVFARTCFPVLILTRHESEETFNADIFKRLGELGLLGVTVPPEYGGSGMDASAACIVHEELSAADPACCLSYLGKCGRETYRRIRKITHFVRRFSETILSITSGAQTTKLVASERCHESRYFHWHIAWHLPSPHRRENQLEVFVQRDGRGLSSSSSSVFHSLKNVDSRQCTRSLSPT